ncbi:MAG: biotin/lipoyl-containing protein [Rhizomicrobium sp.]
MEHLFTIGSEEHLIWLARRRNVFQLSHRGSETPVSLEQCSENICRLNTGEASDVIALAVRGDTFYVHLNGETHELIYRNVISRFETKSARTADDVVRAPMPGTVVHLPVHPGDPVTAGDAVVVIESMKLEMVLRAPRTGTIKSLSMAAGDKFERDTILASLEPLVES